MQRILGCKPLCGNRFNRFDTSDSPSFASDEVLLRRASCVLIDFGQAPVAPGMKRAGRKNPGKKEKSNTLIQPIVFWTTNLKQKPM